MIVATVRQSAVRCSQRGEASRNLAGKVPILEVVILPAKPSRARLHQ